MIEKIKELLGEEIANTVSEKLGKVELGIINDGTLVPATKFDGLKAEHKELQEKYKTEIDEVSQKLDAALKEAGDADKFKSAVEDLKAKQKETIDGYEEKIKSMAKDTALKLALTDAGVRNEKAVRALLELDKVVLDGEKLIGLDEQVEKLRESDDYLFHQKVKKGHEPNGGGDAGPKGELAKLQEAYEKAGATDKILILDQIKNLERE